MTAYIQYPTWLQPNIFPFWPALPLRWYGIMYIVAFAITYFLFKYQVKQRKLNYSSNMISDFFFAGIAGLIIGARIFGTLLYDPSGMYLQKPWLIFWPFGEGGRFIGFMGMSFHGGLIGLVIGFLIYSKIKKIDFLEWADMIAVSVPLGYTFGRLGNFINGELWGKVSTAPWAMVFPHATPFSVNLEWVRSIAEKISMPITGSTLNLPRHPSQLYEALFEGIILWLVLWFFVRPQKTPKGFAVGAYIFGYGLVRFFIEYFREPDADIGYVIAFGNPEASIHLYTTPFNFSMGQILCFLMIVVGLSFMLYRVKVAKHAKILEASSNKSKHKKK